MAASAPARLERIAFRTSRLLDFVGRRELTAQIGHAPESWPLVIVKELVDNALDACEEAEIAPEIEVRVNTDTGEISVADNGPGIRPETVADILDFGVRVSSREAYVSPTRGAQGNALKTIIAMPFALDSGKGETIIESRGIEHRIVFAADQVRQEPKIEHLTAASQIVRNGTCVTVRWPDSASAMLAGAGKRFLQMVSEYIFLNPHLTLRYYWNNRLTQVPASEPRWQKWRACDLTSAHWYDAPRLARYAAALVSHDQDHARERTVREFLGEFRGLSGSGKQKHVIEAAGMARLPLAALFEDGAADAERVAALLRAMCQHSRPVKPKDLGVIGSDHWRKLCAGVGGRDDTFRYRRIAEEDENGIPYVVEAAFAARPHHATRAIVTGVNFSAAIGSPFRTFADEYEGLETLLVEQRCGGGEPIVVLLHLTFPHIAFRDRGKTSLVLSEGIVTSILAAVQNVTSAWAKQCKAEERDKRREQQRWARLAHEKQDRVTTKDAAWQVMRQAYLKASNNGRLPAKPRQIMYAARPAILKLTGKEALNDTYFTQTLLPDYIETHPEECSDWNIVWDARGHFTEPHTGREVALGTLEVRRYLSLTASQPPIEISSPVHYSTVGPEHRYDTLLFVEKEGFSPLFATVELGDRYDLAIMSTKGMSVTAARMLIDRLSRRGLKRILVLRDFDVAGFSIFGTLGTSGRRYRFTNDVSVTDLGLRLADVEAMSLQSEPAALDKSEWQKREATLRRHGATKAEIAFLKTRRVELNAMTSPELVAFIERKLAEHGVGKIVPDADIVEAHARRLIERGLAHAAFDQLRPKIIKQAKAAILPADLRQQIEAELAKDPTKAWDDALATITVVA
jgi:DNA topoisomerase VI subunit B